MNNEIKLISKAFINYFDLYKIVYKRVDYKYRIELFTTRYTIFIKIKITLDDDFCRIKIYNDQTNKNIEKLINFDDDLINNFGHDNIKKLFKQID